MTVRAPALSVALALAAIALGQAPAPVTLADLDTAWRRVDRAAAAVLQVAPLTAGTVEEGTRPATRADLIDRLDRSFQRFRTKVRSTPRAIPIDARAIETRNPAAVRERLERLVAWGLVPPTGFLVTGPADTMTPRQVGNALGHFVSRLAELTHRPSSRFSPDLMSDGS